MDSAELRFLILALGVLFVAALYLWERHKSSHAQHNRRKRFQNMIDSRGDGDSDDSPGDTEVKPEIMTIRNMEHPAYSQEVRQQEAAGSHHESGEEVDIEPPPHKEEILSFSVASRRKFFTGDAIASVMHAANLSRGPMDIYYRYSSDGSEILFAVASMVEPGSFPQDMSRFRSSGLSLFARLPGSLDGVVIFDEMYEASRLIAENLDGILLGNDHKPLMEDALDEMRALASGIPALRRRSIKADAE